MKYFKMIFSAVSLLIFTNVVIAENKRTIANPNVNAEVRSTEDKVNNSSDFISINSDSNAAKMSSVSSKDKSKRVKTQVAGVVQLQSNNKDVVKKYNNFSNESGEKKNKKNM